MLLSIDPHLLSTSFHFLHQIADFDTMEDADANNHNPHLLATSFHFLQQIADFDTMEDADGNNQDAHRDIVRATVGRSSGNFKIDEGMKLASAYLFVTTNAAAGTDQDGETYRKKIRNSFIQRGGFAIHTILSLKNHFNKVL